MKLMTLLRPSHGLSYDWESPTSSYRLCILLGVQEAMYKNTECVGHRKQKSNIPRAWSIYVRW